MAGVERGVLGTPEFNPFAAGARKYGMGRTNPTSGAVDPSGYAARDLKRKAKMNALAAKTKASAKGNYASPNYLRSL